MARAKPKPRMAWKTLLWSTEITAEDVGKMKLSRNGYVSYFETLDDAVEYKRRQLERIARQYLDLKLEMPEDYKKQIQEMRNKYGER